MFYLHDCLCFAGGVHGDQKKALDALELELETVVSHHVGTGTQTQILCKNNRS